MIKNDRKRGLQMMPSYWHNILYMVVKRKHSAAANNTFLDGKSFCMCILSAHNHLIYAVNDHCNKTFL